MPNATPDDGVSIIVRTTGTRNGELSRALSSIVGNGYRPIEVVVVYQGLDADRLATVQALASSTIGNCAVVVQNARSEDCRTENLNIGWATAKGRYVGFLDDDDSLRPFHILSLVRALKATDAAWAYGQTELVEEDLELRAVGRSYPFYRGRYSFTELLIENFIPIHSFLIDRTRLNPTLVDRPFYEPLNRGEDWDFLIRLAYFHEPAVIDDVTCTYFASNAGRNVNVSLVRGDGQSVKRQSWEQTESLLAARRRDLLSGSPREAEYGRSLAVTGSAGIVLRAVRKARLRLDQLLFRSRRGLQDAK